MRGAREQLSQTTNGTLTESGRVGARTPAFLDGFDDLSIARRYAAESIALLRRSGFSVAMEFDLSDWVQIMAKIPDSVMLNPAFDPRHSRLDATNSFWLRISDADGTCAIIADKYVVTDDYLKDMAAGRVYYETPGEHQRIELEPGLPMGKYTGRIGCAGGLWVHPRARKQGLSWLLPRLVRAYSIQFWDVERHCAIVVEGTRKSGLVENAYGFQEVHLMSTGYFPPTDRDQQIYVIHIDREEIMNQFLLDLEAMSKNSDQKVRDVATIVGHRKDQPLVRGRESGVLG
jgi:GNAT superfamily N-acetyltransferase